MDEKEIVKEVLSSYEEIELLNEENGVIFFKLYSNEYGLIYPSANVLTDKAHIIIKNSEDYNIPHILWKEHSLGGIIYRVICLYEAGSQVEFLKSYEEKILETVDRLLDLLNLTDLEIEKEFQKEFLLYWNSQAKSIVNAFISSDRIFHKMNVYTNDKRECRFVSKGIELNDKSKYGHTPNLNVYYIPIIDTRRLLPPIKNKLWTSTDVLKILCGRDYKRISSETFEAIKSEIISENEIILIFEMIVNQQRITFGLNLKFRRMDGANILEKIKYATEDLSYLKINRCDYQFLNSQIGNDTFLIGKRIGLIGCGSLGSYIATELVKSGVKNLGVYDSDKIEAANVLRHNTEYCCCGYSKVVALQFKLEQIHPEIIIEPNNKDVTAEILEKDMNKYDMLIFAVGSSDVQLLSNRVLKLKEYGKPVLFVWLEAGGKNSHILCVEYLQSGCFECLYTDQNGGFINNKVNMITDEQAEEFVLRNGCGATRVAYGTDILLRTTSAVLNTVKKVFEGEIKQNILIDIDKETVIQQGNIFIEGRCNCCGDSDRE